MEVKGVRMRPQPQSKTVVRERREKHRCALSPDDAAGNFMGTSDWFRAAAAYAGRRTYRTSGIRIRALARREQIVTEAARVIQDCASEIFALVPASFRPSPSIAEFRAAYGKAKTPKDQMNAARAWLMFTLRRTERYAREDGGTAKRAGIEIKSRAVARLAEWAKEMDADDYGE